jgi:hypothetical protein
MESESSPLRGEVLPAPVEAARLDDETGLLEVLPGLLRIGVGAWLRTAEWTLGTTRRAGERVVRAAVSGESPAAFLQETGAELRQHLRHLLGIVEDERGIKVVQPEPRRASRPAMPASLRERGSELLRRSADVAYEEDAHPAYERILDELAPDEARILRLLYLDGPQPAVDVRASKTFNVSSELVAPGLSMIGAQAGCRHLERLPAYLNNLFRLGLIWFSREPLEDPRRYQVLEAQPDVLAALRTSAGRARTVRRSIHLTPFGIDFCEVCLPLDGARTPSGVQSEHAMPPEEQDGSPPPAGDS